MEGCVREYLSNNLDVPVYLDTPPNPPDSYVSLEKTGSSRIDHIITDTLAIQSYGASRYEASELNKIVLQKIEEMEAEPWNGGVFIDTDYNFTDTTTKRNRYQALVRVVHC